MPLPILTETLLPISKQDIKDFIPKKVEEHSFVIMFDNFLRDKLTFELIKSIQIFYPTVKMYIAEQGVFNPIKDELYRKLEEAGHKIIYVGFDAGLSVCRNKLIENIEEPYVFYCDSDNLFIKETRIEELQTILESNPELGLISCLEYKNDEPWHYEKNLTVSKGLVKYLDVSKSEDNYFICDMTMNVGLLRKKMCDEVKWDNRMKVAEHLDYFLSIQKTNWKVGCCQIVFIKNQNYNFNNQDYKAYRGRNVDFWKLYREKWELTSIDGWPIPDTEIKFEKPSQIHVKVEESIDTEKADVNTQIINFLKKIKPYLSIVCLLKNSCLEAIKYHQFMTPTLTLGIKNLDVKEVIEKIYKDNSFTFKLETILEPQRTIKIYQVDKITINVPLPVKEYLIKTYNKSWTELMVKK